MDHAILDEELRAALRAALRITSRTSAAFGDDFSILSEDGPPQGRSPGFRKLVDGILFSRRFILTYHALIITLLLLFTTLHWGGKIVRWHKRQRPAKHTQREISNDKFVQISTLAKTERVTGQEHGGSSSSSSTLEGTACLSSGLKSGIGDEQTPLLRPSKTVTSHRHQTSLGRRVRAWLTHQPKPIPVIDKIMPPNSTTLAVIVLYTVNIFYMFYKVQFSIPLLFIFADRTSLLFVANLPLLYLFAAKNQPMKLLTGYSYESLNILHRRLGEITCLLALLHSAGMIGVWYTLLRPTGFTLARFLLSKVILLGIGAFVAYETLYFTSLGSFRQRWYELFLGLHVVLQLIALVLLWFHHKGSRVYVAIALAIFLADRLIYRMTIKTSTFRANLSIPEDKETVKLHVTIPRSHHHQTLHQTLGSNITHGWKPTHHIFLTIPSLSRKHIIQAHPFTIASRAPSPDAEIAELDLVIRAQDGFSGDLLRYAKGHDTVAVRIDGPYGSQSAVELLRDSDLSIIVAGGSGIAVAWPLIWSLIDEKRIRDPENPLSAGSAKRILLIWVIQSSTHKTWLDIDQLTNLQAREGVEVMIPPPTSQHGRPDVEGLIETWLEHQESLDAKGHGVKIGVVCSGPDSMNRAVRNTCSRMQGRGVDVGVEVEKFGW